MAEGALVATADGILGAILQDIPFSISNPHLALHIGPPGAAGTANPAAETRRFDLSAMFGTAASAGSITNDAASAVMTSVAATEVWSHWVIWDDPTAGSPYLSGTLTGGSVTLGQDAQINASQMTVSMPVAS